MLSPRQYIKVSWLPFALLYFALALFLFLYGLIFSYSSLVGVMILFGFLFTYFALFNLEWSIIVLLIIIPFTPILYLTPEGIITLPKLITVLLLLVWSARILITRDSRPLEDFPRSRINIYMLLFTLPFFLSLIPCEDLSVGIFFFLDITAHIFLYFLVVYNLSRKEYLQKAVGAILAISLVISIFGFWEMGTGKSIQSLFGRKTYLISGSGYGYLISGRKEILHPEEEAAWVRVMSTFTDPNSYGAFLVSMLGLATGAVLANRAKIKRFLLLLLILILLLNLLATGSRGALLGLGVLVLVFLFRLKFPGKGVIMSTALILGFVGIFLINTSPYFSQFREGLSWEAISKDERWAWLQMGGKMIRAHPFIGVGTGQFHIVYNRYLVPSAPKDIFLPHNTFIQMWSEEGILGLGMFLLLVGGVSLELLYVFNNSQDPYLRYLSLGIFASWAGMLTYSLTSNVLLDETFWILIALAGCISLIYRKGLREKEENG